MEGREAWFFCSAAISWAFPKASASFDRCMFLDAGRICWPGLCQAPTGVCAELGHAFSFHFEYFRTCSPVLRRIHVLLHRSHFVQILKVKFCSQTFSRQARYALDRWTGAQARSRLQARDHLPARMSDLSGIIAFRHHRVFVGGTLLDGVFSVGALMQVLPPWTTWDAFFFGFGLPRARVHGSQRDRFGGDLAQESH